MFPSEDPMKGLRMLASAVVLTALSFPLFSQPNSPTTGYHNVQCYKIKPDKGLEFRKWAEGDLHKYAQGLVDSGRLSSWTLVRAVTPAGSASSCDYFMVAFYPGLPPEPLGVTDLGPLLKKAGLTMTAEEWIGRRDSMSSLVSTSLWQNYVAVRSMQKGDYIIVNEAKAPDVDEWVAYEKKAWQPIAEQLDKEGLTRGWSVNVLVLPQRGSENRINGVTVDVYPSWDAVIKLMIDPEFENRWRKIHPDMEIGTTFEHYDKLRNNLTANVFKVDDMISVK
jgi:hypothetical protein